MSWPSASWSNEPASPKSLAQPARSASSTLKKRLPSTPVELQQWLLQIFCGDSLSAHVHLDSALAPDFIHQQAGRSMTLEQFSEHVADFRQYWTMSIESIDAFMAGPDRCAARYFTTQTLPKQRDLPAGWIVKLEVMLTCHFDEKSGKCRRWLVVQRELKDDEAWPPTFA